NCPCRADPDGAVLDPYVAIRPARMVDEARDVAAHGRVDNGSVGQLEAPDVAALDVAALAPQALLVRDLLACVIDDALVLRNLRRGEHAEPVNLRPPPAEHLIKIAHALLRRGSAAASAERHRAVQPRRILRAARDARAVVACRAARCAASVSGHP